MEIKEALSVLGYRELADDESRRKLYRQIKFELQQRANRGELGIDLAEVNTAIDVFDRWISGDETASKAENVAAASALQMLAAAPGFDPTDLGDRAEPQRDSSPQATGTPKKKKQSTARSRGDNTGLMVGVGLAAFGALMFGLGAAANSSPKNEDEW